LVTLSKSFLTALKLLRLLVIEQQDVPRIAVRADSIQEVLDRCGPRFYNLKLTSLASGTLHDLSQKLVESRLQCLVAFEIDPKLRYHRFPPISPFRHSSPSVYLSNQIESCFLRRRLN